MKNKEEVISQVFDLWNGYAKTKSKLTERRKRLIETVLEKISLEEAMSIIKYMFESDDDYVLYMRQNNYTSFENIFRPTKLEDKLAKAKSWKSSFELPEDDFGWDIK